MVTTKSRKSKGRLGQHEVRDKLLEAFPDLQNSDITSQIMGMRGEDILLSPKAREAIPCTFEVKRRKSGLTTLYNYYKQAKNHKKGEPVVALRQDREDWLAVISLDYFIKLLSGEKND